MKCPYCRFENLPETRFCGQCGAPLEPSDTKEKSGGTRTAEAAVLQELRTGTTFAGRYQVVEELGKGGMGRVYKVIDEKIKEKVALKLLKPEISTDGAAIERFSTELRLARKISHRNVCRMFDLGEAEGTHFITMEYVHGEDLKSMIRMSTGLTVGTVLSVGKQVCDGLAEAHSLGVVHRDLKPQNIMIDRGGNAKIMDFGIARSLRERGITGAGVLIGTPEYMSPEQAEAKEVDQRSDIYSLGVVLYEMATGRVPFEGETALSVALKHKSEIPKDPRSLNPDIPADLGGAILRCLEKGREKRFQSAGELRAELARIEEEIPTAERAISRKKPSGSRRMPGGKGRSRWTRIALYGGAVAVLVLIAYAGFRLFPGGQEPIDSIAVLPFENVSADPDTDYLCDGITETIINKLSQLSGFKKVIARNSVFAYKGRTVDAQRVGQELGVRAVLLTRMARLGDRLTISPTLVRAKDNSQIWGERYERKFEDIFAIEESIAASIVQALRLNLTREDRHKIVERPFDDPATYQWYLWADYEIGRFRSDSLDNAVRTIENALEAGGPNALLYTAMARAYYGYVNIGARQEDYIAKAEDYARKALALDPKLSRAHSVLGTLYSYSDIREGIRQYRMALELDPNDPNALFGLVMFYLDSGKSSAARPLMERYQRVNPLDSGNFIQQGYDSLFGGRFKQALDSFRRWHQSDPVNAAGAFFYALALAYTDERDEAFSIIDKCAEAEPGNALCKFGLMLKYALLKDRAKVFSIMTPDLRLTCRRDLEWSYFVAQPFALLDEKQEALDWLENAVNRGFINHPFMSALDPFLANVRGEERFRKLMERVKNEWEHFAE